MGDDELKHGITEKFESLVVEMECLPLEREARMGKGLRQE